MNTTRVISIARLSNAPMLPFLVLNPAVAIVVNVWHTESNNVMPAINNARICTAVSPR